ncbi:MAG: transcription termination/antitermination protein NusG [SAR324 cluster bacterium]|nr:transcription termination/antitermination protein NusG [SAR324 cluster bacterium]
MTELTPKWYALQAYAGHEQKVKLLILEQLELTGLTSMVEEIFIPTEEVTTKKKDKIRVSNVTYYPGYIFIRARLSDELSHVLRSVPRVSGFIGQDQAHPLPVAEKEINAIRGQIDQGVKQQEIDSTYTIGQKVFVVEGPFADFSGIIDKVDPEHNKLSVLVSIFGRSTPLELTFDKVKLEE